MVSGYVLVHEAGDAFTIKQLRRRAYRLMELLGLRRVRLYDARSSCFTFLADNGVPGHILARWAGHTNVKRTKRWYVKPDVEDLRGAATTWDGLQGGRGGGASVNHAVCEPSGFRDAPVLILGASTLLVTRACVLNEDVKLGSLPPLVR